MKRATWFHFVSLSQKTVIQLSHEREARIAAPRGGRTSVTRDRPPYPGRGAHSHRGPPAGRGRRGARFSRLDEVLARISSAGGTASGRRRRPLADRGPRSGADAG